MTSWWTSFSFAHYWRGQRTCALSSLKVQPLADVGEQRAQRPQIEEDVQDGRTSLDSIGLCIVQSDQRTCRRMSKESNLSRLPSARIKGPLHRGERSYRR